MRREMEGMEGMVQTFHFLKFISLRELAPHPLNRTCRYQSLAVEFDKTHETHKQSLAK